MRPLRALPCRHAAEDEVAHFDIEMEYEQIGHPKACCVALNILLKAAWPRIGRALKHIMQ